MVLITEDLVRKRAEHNNLEIATLEELSLHQLDIEKLEHLDKWCRDLKILYLQSNLIPKIENVKRLKKLEYLNLALNNIRRIENLEGCESLNKLDLTVNFVGELTSIENLKSNREMRELFLTGNPCAEYVGYREYVITMLPALKYLDGREIDRSERILAAQKFSEIKDSILQQQRLYLEKEGRRMASSDTGEAGKDGRWYTDINESDGRRKEKEDKSYWDQPSEFTPESRVELYKHMEEEKRKREAESNSNRFEDMIPSREVRLFNDEGKPFNVNQAKIGFKLTESDDNSAFELDVSCYKHLDTSQIDLDVQPWYVKVTIKGKVLQLVLSEEVNPDRSSAKRSQVTGNLLVTIPKLIQVNGKPTQKMSNPSDMRTKQKKSSDRVDYAKVRQNVTLNDMFNIVPDKKETNALRNQNQKSYNKLNAKDTPIDASRVLELDKDFVDDPDVPPLI